MLRVIVVSSVVLVLITRVLSDCMSNEDLKLSKQSINLKAIQCNASEKYVFKNYSCFAKSYSRTCSTVNVMAIARYPLMNIHVLARLFFKYGTIYREVMHTPLINWCATPLNQTTNLMIKQAILFANEIVPGIVHACPYMEVIVRNATTRTNSLISIFPTGDYKLIVYVYAGPEELIATANIIGSVLSPEKGTFG